MCPQGSEKDFWRKYLEEMGLLVVLNGIKSGGLLDVNNPVTNKQMR